MARSTKAPARKVGESDAEYLNRLVGRANQRLRALEKLSGETGFEHVKEWSYKRARKDILRLWENKNPEKPRFSPSGGDNIRAKINAVVNFLNSPTSTKTGIKETYQKRADTFNQNHPGANVTWEDIGNFFGSELARDAMNKYDSDTLAEMFTEMNKSGLTYEDIMEAKNKNQQIVDDAVLDRLMKQIVSEYSSKWKKKGKRTKKGKAKA